MTYATRKPIKNTNKKIVAYDLKYDSGENALKDMIKHLLGEGESTEKLNNAPTILEIRKENLDSYTEEYLLMLPKDYVLIQVNSALLPDENIARLIRILKERGFKVVIEINKEDRVFTLAKAFADIIKFDVSYIEESENIESLRQGFIGKILVIDVNSPEDYNKISKINADYYEGSYIDNSEIKFEVAENKHSKINFTEVIRALNEDLDPRDMAKIISRDSLLSAQIIKISNSACYGGRTRIKNVESAIIRIGQVNVRGILYLMEFTTCTEQVEQLLQTSYHRALFCEYIKIESKIKKLDLDEAYMIGLLSLLGVITTKPMPQALSGLGLDKKIEYALVYREGVGGSLINFIESYESADWDRVKFYEKEFNIKEGKVFELYYKALGMVQQTWRTLRGTQNAEI